MIVGKYGEKEGGWWSKYFREGYGVGLRRAIGCGGRRFMTGLALEWDMIKE